jgi:hypothetical protein
LCFAEFAEFGQPRIFSTEGTIRIKKEEIKAIAETKTKMVILILLLWQFKI